MMWELGLTRGCVDNGPGDRWYCVDDPVTEGQLSVFVTRARLNLPAWSDVPSAYSYSCAPYFYDVAASNSFFRQVQRTAQDGVWCGSGNWCGINAQVTRDQAAAFIMRGFFGMGPQCAPPATLPACTNLACGATSACGDWCCQGSGCLPVGCDACQQPNACGD